MGVGFHIPSLPLCWRTTESSAAIQACLEGIPPPLRLWTFSRYFLKTAFGGGCFPPALAQGQANQHSQLESTGAACVEYRVHLPAGLKGTDLPVLFHESEGGVSTRLAFPGRLPGGLAFWRFFQPDLVKLLESNRAMAKVPEGVQGWAALIM